MITTYRLGMGTNYRLGIHRYSCGPPLFTTYCLGVQRYPCGPPLFNTYRLGMGTNYLYDLRLGDERLLFCP